MRLVVNKKNVGDFQIYLVEIRIGHSEYYPLIPIREKGCLGPPWSFDANMVNVCHITLCVTHCGGCNLVWKDRPAETRQITCWWRHPGFNSRLRRVVVIFFRWGKNCFNKTWETLRGGQKPGEVEQITNERVSGAMETTRNKFVPKRTDPIFTNLNPFVARKARTLSLLWFIISKVLG